MVALTRILAVPFLLLSALSIRAQTVTSQQVTCESSWPNNVYPSNNNIYPLVSRQLSDGRVEWYGRFKMYSPRGNNTACYIRQILFSTGPLVSDLNPGAPDAPKVTVVVQHGFFHCRAKDMIVSSNLQPQPVGPGTFYTEQADQAKGESKSGIYYAKISVIGRERH